MDSSNSLRVKDAISARYQTAFKFECFNKMQSILLPSVYRHDKNLAVASPTGSGKTVIHELAILRILEDKVTAKDVKCVFIAPNKALCQQRAAEWTEKFSLFGLLVLEVTGDVDMQQSLKLVAQASIIITTPEKWDSMTRSWRRHLFLLGLVDLLLIDEIHHLGEDRGATLETVIVRMRILNSAYIKASNKGCSEEELKKKPGVRIIALSATLPNIVDIGVWLGCSQDGIHYFDEGFRPVPLETHTIAYHPGANTFLFEKSLDEKVPDILHRYSNHQQSLIFCSSKRGTETLAASLAERYRCENGAQRAAPEARALLSGISDIKLRNLVSRGLAYHHAGLPPDDRGIVERLYLSGAIHVLCSTSTLAHGVNLPAHLVVIKGTNCWRGGGRGYEKMARSEVIQMVGRAGRPGFDTKGVAVIMTSTDDKELYEGVSLTADVVESTLPARLIEAICTEVTQSVINSLAEAVTWLRSTFFYVRVKRNHSAYGLNDIRDDTHLETLLEDMVVQSVEQLAAAQIVQFDKESTGVTANPEAHIMSRHIITFKTMEALLALPRICSLPVLLANLSKCEELGKPVRRSEKKYLNDNMRNVRFPLKGLIKDPWQKVYVLLQLAATHAFIPDFTLRVEQSEIVEVSMRVLTALQELCVCHLNGSLLESCVLIERALRLRVWETDFHSIFNQCTHISDFTRKKLVDKGFVKVEDVRDLTVKDIQARLTCSLDEAQALIQFTHQFQMARVDVTLSFHSQRKSLDISIAPLANQMPSAANGHQSLPTSSYPRFTVVCYHQPSGLLLCYRHVTLLPVPASVSTNPQRHPQQRSVELQKQSFTVPISDPTIDFEDIRCVTLSSIVGTDNIHKARDHSQQQTQVEASEPAAKRVVRKKVKDTTMDAYYPPGEIVAANVMSHGTNTTATTATIANTAPHPPPQITAFQQPRQAPEPGPRVELQAKAGVNLKSFEDYNYNPDTDPWKVSTEPIIQKPTQPAVKLQTPRVTLGESSMGSMYSGGNELAIARRKGAELRGFQIDCPVKRLRTLSTPASATATPLTTNTNLPPVPQMTQEWTPQSMSPPAVNRPLHPEFLAEAQTGSFLAPQVSWLAPAQSNYQTMPLPGYANAPVYNNLSSVDLYPQYAQSSYPFQPQPQPQPQPQQPLYHPQYQTQHQIQPEHQYYSPPQYEQPMHLTPQQPQQYYYQQQSSTRAPTAGTFLEETRIRAWTDAPASAAFRAPYQHEPKFTPTETYVHQHQQQQYQQLQKQKQKQQCQPHEHSRVTQLQDSAMPHQLTATTDAYKNPRSETRMKQVPESLTENLLSANIPTKTVAGQAGASKRSAAWNIGGTAEKATPSVASAKHIMSFEDAGFF